MSHSDVSSKRVWDEGGHLPPQEDTLLRGRSSINGEMGKREQEIDSLTLADGFVPVPYNTAFTDPDISQLE